jgi:hypothetical protein
MKTTLLVAILFGTMVTAFAEPVIVSSPDHAKTFAYGEMVWHQLYLDRDTLSLTARITFSNRPYAGSPEGQIDEPFDFRFPGTHFDPATRVIFVRTRPGKAIAVARCHGTAGGGSADLSSGAKVYLIKRSGQVSALLTATDGPREGMRWIQMNENWSLQNLFAGLRRATR